MKKTLLATFVLAMATAVSAYGDVPEITIRQVPVGNVQRVAKRAPETISSVDFSYCGYPLIAQPFEAGTKVSAAMYLPTEVLKLYDGARITSINVFVGANLEANPVCNSIREGEVWITENLDADPLTSAHGYLGDQIMAYHPISLDEPFTLSADRPVYVGFTVTSPGPSQGALVWDQNLHENDWGGWMRQGDGPWTNMSGAWGFVLIKCTIEGDNIPQTSASIYSTEVSQFTFPGKTVSDDILILNEGAQEINEVRLTIKAGDDELAKGNFPLDEPIKFNDLFRLIVETRCTTTGANVPLHIEVTEVNGQPNENSKNTVTDHFLCLPENGGFDRNIVMEYGAAQEIGGTLMAIVADRKMTDTYGDSESYIPLMVHMYDEMYTASYEPFFTDRMCSTIPSGIPDRLIDFRNTQADLSNIEDAYAVARTFPAFATLNVRGEYTDENREEIIITTDSRFLDNAEGDWGLAFVTRRNNVGPYRIENPYSGKDEDMGGFEKDPNPTEIKFNHVATEIDTYYGIPESIPASVEKDKVYTHTRQMPLSAEEAKDTDIVVMLINRLNGMIENAAVLKGSEITPSSVNGIETTAVRVTGGNGFINIDGEYTKAGIYTVAGSLAAGLSGENHVSLPAGIYIVVVDGRATKAIVR